MKTTAAALAGLMFTSVGAAAPGGPALLTDRAAMAQLVSAVSLDVMTEASVDACHDIGAASAGALRAAWVGWRERHQVAPLRMVMISLQQRDAGVTPPWRRMTEPMRARVLADPAPDRTCAALAQDLQGAAMDVGAQFPQARAVAQGLLQARLAYRPTLPDTLPGAPRGQVLLPSQIPALVSQHGRWTAINDDAARQRLGWVHVRGRVERHGSDGDRYRLVQEQGGRRSPHAISLDVSAEPWVGREVVLRGLFSSLDTSYANLAAAALVADATGLAPSPLPQAPLERREVLPRRVQTAPGRGLTDKTLAAVVLHGEADHVNGARWQDDVRYLLRDGSFYRRAGTPPDQLDVAASRRLEPQHWGRWRAAGGAYEMQAQDDDGRPSGGWQAAPHQPVRPWPAGTRLDGRYVRSSFTGSSFFGGISRTDTLHFKPDGRFERSVHGLSSTGTMQAITGTVIGGSSHGDGQGSSSVGGGSVATGSGTVGAVAGSRRDDGASRRGRYELQGFSITLHHDDGRTERLLSFPVGRDGRSVYVGDGSYDRER